jgi:hypothetical protein
MTTSLRMDMAKNPLFTTNKLSRLNMAKNPLFMIDMPTITLA